MEGGSDTCWVHMCGVVRRRVWNGGRKWYLLGPHVWSGKEEGMEWREEVVPVGSTCVEVKSSDIVRLE